MKKLTLTSTHLLAILTIIFFALLLFSCGSFQGSSYYSDGIYSSEGTPRVTTRSTPSPQSEQNNTSPSQDYYSQRFQNMADDYTSINEEPVYFTDTDQYNSNETTSTQTVDDTNYSQAVTTNNYSQPAWGSDPSTTNVYVINNRPWFNDPFFYGYGFNQPYWGWGFYNPYRPWRWRSPFRFSYRPYYDWSFYGSFYNPYYHPVAFGHPAYGGFYNPYYYQGFRNYRIDRRNGRYGSNIAWVRGRRGERMYSNSRGVNNRVNTQRQTRTSNTQGINQYHSGSRSNVTRSNGQVNNSRTATVRSTRTNVRNQGQERVINSRSSGSRSAVNNGRSATQNQQTVQGSTRVRSSSNTPANYTRSNNTGSSRSVQRNTNTRSYRQQPANNSGKSSARRSSYSSTKSSSYSSGRSSSYRSSGASRSSSGRSSGRSSSGRRH